MVRTIKNLNDIIKKLQKDNDILQLTKSKYDALYDEIPDLCRTINKEGIILDCNKSYAKTMGYSKRESIGSSIFEHTSDDDHSKLRKSLKKWAKTGRSKNLHIKFKKKDGTIFPVTLDATSIFDKNGNLIGSNTVIKDQSEISVLQKLQYQKDDFFAVASHELKTPLYQISGYGELLLSERLGQLNPKQTDALKVLIDGSEKLDKLITNIIEAQKLEIDATKPVSKPIDVGNLLSLTYKDNSYIMKEKMIKFVNGFKSCKKLIIKSDKYLIAHVFSNLIQNAIDFVPKENPRIEIGAQSDNDNIIFYVKDNGIGIQRDDLNDIFKKFYQVDVSTGRKKGGIGLGLAICKKEVKKLGGRIWAESEGEGKGSTFYFSLKKVIKN